MFGCQDDEPESDVKNFLLAIIEYLEPLRMELVKDKPCSWKSALQNFQPPPSAISDFDCCHISSVYASFSNSMSNL